MRIERTHRKKIVLSGFVIGLVCIAGTAEVLSDDKEGAKMNDQKLTSMEDWVINHRGTEPPFSGRYLYNHDKGVYVCARCGTPLFRSDRKFDSGCGWPSFDESLPGAVKQVPDADGHRVEITCAHCGAHLGHVFFGEGFTDKNVRHCVNSVSLGFKAEAPTQTAEAIFAGGCFWGVEYYFEKAPGVLDVKSGYIGGLKDSPTYEQVCAGNTGHLEAVRVTYDPSRTDYETLAKLFFEIHDPTELNRQGPDLGYQYRSAIFYRNTKEKAIADALVAELKANGYNVVTDIRPAGKFWEAEDYHQDYYERTGKTPYCHARVKRFK